MAQTDAVKKDKRRRRRLRLLLFATLFFSTVILMIVCVIMGIRLHTVKGELRDTLALLQDKTAVTDQAENAAQRTAEDAEASLYTVSGVEEYEKAGVAAEDAGEEAADEQVRKVYLTFDDGPSSNTGRILDILADYDVKATFFVVGRNIPGNEELIRRMDEEGHLIGNHTYDHVKISGLSGQEACEQIEKTNRLIRRLTGSDAEFVRPPFGEWNKEMEYSFVMIPVLWDVDPKDWLTRNVSDIVRRVLEDTQSGDIILLHDYYDTSVEAALQIVDRLKEQDYEFVTVDELILE